MNIKETFHINGENLLMSFPVTVGVIGAVFAPIFAAVGALAALLTDCKITVERDPNKGDDNDKSADTESHEIIVK